MSNHLNQHNPVPRVSLGALIFNEHDELLLVQSHKWGGQYGIPAGKLKMNEPLQEGLKREIKEETNLDVHDIQFLLTQELIQPKNFFMEAHFISMNYRCRVLSGDVQLNDEAYHYTWVQAEEAFRLDLNRPTRELIEHYFNVLNEDKIIIRDLAVNCIVGIHPRERIQEQTILISTEIMKSTRQAARGDDIKQTIDYGDLEKEIEMLVITKKYSLLETMANDIAEYILTKHRVGSVRVVIKKPGAIINGKYAAVDICREKRVSCHTQISGKIPT